MCCRLSRSAENLTERQHRSGAKSASRTGCSSSNSKKDAWSTVDIDINGYPQKKQPKQRQQYRSMDKLGSGTGSETKPAVFNSVRVRQFRHQMETCMVCWLTVMAFHVHRFDRLILKSYGMAAYLLDYSNDYD